MSSTDPNEATPASPRDSVTLPINETTLVQHVKSHAGRLKRLEDSGHQITESVKTMLARFLADLTAQNEARDRKLEQKVEVLETMTGNQDKFLTRIDGGVWLATRVIAPGIVVLASAAWALYTFLHK